jgi:hypothetical protein
LTIAFIVKSNEINKADDVEAQKRLMKEFKIEAVILDRGLEYLIISNLL